VRDGSLIFKVEDGQIVAVLQNASLDQFYERTFRKAYRRARGSRRSVEAGINVIVFGAFWLEAHANQFLRDALGLEARSQAFGSALWTALRRSALLEKLDLFYALASDSLAAQHSEVKSGVKVLLDLRNRLAHFKDEHIRIGDPVADVPEAVTVLQTAEDPDLIKQLRAPAVLKHGQAVLGAYRWMSRVQRSHAKIRGSHIKSVRLSRQRAEP
jgi:hypothetical protein